MEKHQVDNLIWLVKSGDRILGPFTIDELKRKLISKEFVVIDEVTSPGKRWRYFQQEPIFAKIVEDIRKSQSQQREDTELGTLSMATKSTGTTDVTEDLEWQKTNPEIESDLDHGNGAVQDAEILNEVDYSKPASGSATPVKQYGFGQDQQVQKEIARSSNTVWLLTAVVIVFVGIGIYRLQTSAPGQPKDGEFPHLYQQAVAAVKVGDFKTAFKMISDARNLRGGDSEVDLLYATLAMHENPGQTNEAKTMIETIIANEKRDAPLKRAHTAYGLALLQEDDYRNALNSFESALQIDPYYYPAQFNKGVAHFQMKDFEDAVGSFRSILQGGHDPAAMLMLVRSEMGRLDLKKVTGRLEDLISTVETVIPRAADFRPEGWLFLIYLKAMNGSMREVAKLCDNFINVDPYLTQDTYHDPLLDLRPLAWNQLRDICRELTDRGLKISPHYQLVWAACLIHSEAYTDANKVLEDVLARTPDDQDAQAVNAYLNMQMKNDDAAKGALRLAEKAGGTDLSHILGARLCAENKTFACADENWKKLLNKNPPSPAALTGEAFLALQSGQPDLAQTYLHDFNEIAPRYIPMLKLNLSLGGSSQ